MGDDTMSISAATSRQTFLYTLVARYTVFIAAGLVLWMACPFMPVFLRRKPVQLINWMSEKAHITSVGLNFTTILALLSFLLVFLEYFNVSARQSSYILCKQRGSLTNCMEEKAEKWRAERNFWLMAFHFFAWLCVYMMAGQGKEADFNKYAANQRAEEAEAEAAAIAEANKNK